ncbi:SDR family NAD(P)-dependent oxidoreductase [Ruegeria sp. HKCCD7255]|uniref:SDR family NAD(P)-dependent oxidoreductase n=1 Tax=Ruegeria sp. HKCCD7255 TaxID=2683004 RepID=UPI001487BFDB|nr:SDR family NAD(P)-dependent oxidoreductase [Ruegeria sp. HKCCD7255]
MRLAGKVALVTGAGSGIGRAGSMAMAQEGAHVVVTDRDATLAEATVAAIVAQGNQASAIQLDVTDDDALTRTIDEAVKNFGRLDVLHSHAGLQIEGTLEEVEPDGMDASWALNVRAHFIAARATVPHMKSQGGGSVIVTASNSGVQYDRGMIAYATTKHAAVAMVRQMAADYAVHAIRFNALCPGFVDTPFNAGFEKQMGGRAKLESYIEQAIPMSRWATVEEIGHGIVYLASDESAFMTGQALVIDGGECI